MSSTKSIPFDILPTLLSIPRPEVVKRVRPESKAQDTSKPLPEGPASTRQDPPQSIDRKHPPLSDSLETHVQSGVDNSRLSNIGQNVQNGQTLREPHQRPVDLPLRPENASSMPPPIVPSQTVSAQELRETARQTIVRSEKLEVHNQNGTAGQSPRPQSLSPTRPGTRNPSNDSRTSGGKGVTDGDRGAEDHRLDKDGRLENKDSSSLTRRDSLTHNRTERRVRDGEKDRDSDRDRDRGRDRHSERDREKERDRDHRDRDRDRDRDRERDRERERDRDRHRRDDKDRDRDSRKERDNTASRSQVSSPALGTDDRGLVTRPEPPRQDSSRRRDNSQTNGDTESLGKRRRATDDEVCTVDC